MDIKEKVKQFIDANINLFISLLKPGKQCFDLAVKWTDLLGIPHYPNNPSPFPYLNAYEIYTKFSAWHAPYFDLVPNTPNAVPQAGDIVIWDGKLNNGIGHVAVATGVGDTTSFESIDQNWVPGSPCKVIKHSYNYVLGWLHPKVTNSTKPMGDNITRKSSFFDKIWIEEFGQHVNTDQVTEAQLNEFIQVLKSRRVGNGQWDLIKLDAGVGGQNVNHTSVANTLRDSGTGLAEYKQKVKDLLNRLLNL